MSSNKVRSLRKILADSDNLKAKTFSYSDFADVCGNERATLMLRLSAHSEIEQLELLKAFVARTYWGFSDFVFAATLPETGVQIAKLTHALEERCLQSSGLVIGSLNLRPEEENLHFVSIESPSQNIFLKAVGSRLALKLISDFVSSWRPNHMPLEGPVTSDELDDFTSHLDSWRWASERADRLQQLLPEPLFRFLVGATLFSPRFLLLNIARITNLECRLSEE